MAEHEWHFRLHSDAHDLDAIADLFDEKVTIVKDQHGQMQLIMKLPFLANELQSARETAEGVLAKLNANRPDRAW
jgi:hypothetical protein